MDLEFLKKEILPQRSLEIEQGQNAYTRQPIYVVLDMQENYVSGHSDYSPSTNYRGWCFNLGYIDEELEPEERKFQLDDSNLVLPVPITQFFTERIIAFFLTRKAAEEYLQYQNHNLNDGYVYTFYSGYGNYEMDRLLCNG